MIIVLTGQPRHGKSQYAIKLLLDFIKDNEKRQEQGKLARDIYCNIAGINDPDTPTKLPTVLNQDIVFKDKKLWFGEHKDTPDGYIHPNAGAVFIYDECHKVDWIKETSGTLSNNPTCISMNEHGHEDYIFVLITQFPQYIHTHLRGLVELHYHSKRSFGAKGSKIYKWNEFQLSPRADKALKDAYEKEKFSFHKKYQDCYKSASAHDSMKLHIPKPIIYMGLTLVALFGGAYYQFTKSPMLQSMAGQDTAKAQTTPTKAEQATIPKTPQTQAQTQPELTKEQLEQKLKVQEQQFKLELEKQKLEMIMQYEQLHKQFAEQQKQLQDFYARLEMYKTMLPKNYEIIKNDPNLQVRAVVKMGNKCNAYNTHGDLMTLTFEECDYYLQASGRVHRPVANGGTGATVTKLETKPVADILSENPNAYKHLDNKISDKPNDLSDKQGG